LKMNCVVCGKEFNVGKVSYERGQRCCSWECSTKNRKNGKLVHCPVCDKKFYLSKSNIERGRKYCSKNCYYEARLLAHEDFSETNFKINGYKFIYIDGYPIREHVYIIEQHIGRKLAKGEVVHHINYNRQDNRLENLQLMTKSEHTKLHYYDLHKHLRKNEISGRFESKNSEVMF